MSEAADLAVPAAAVTPAAEAAPAAPAAAPEASAAEGVAAAPAAELATPEPKAGEGEAAPAAGQDTGTGEAADGGKSDGEKPQGEDGEAAATGAPETYAAFTLPEGVQMDPTLGEGLTALAKELNLPQDKAQKLVDLGVAQAQAFATAMKTSVENAKTEWADKVRADPVLGGANLSQNMAIAKKAVVAFGSPELIGVLNETGLGTHPAMLRLLYAVGSAISEDTLVDSDSSHGGAPVTKDHAKRLYPKMA